MSASQLANKKSFVNELTKKFENISNNTNNNSNNENKNDENIKPKKSIIYF